MLNDGFSGHLEASMLEERGQVEVDQSRFNSGSDRRQHGGRYF